jgi:hypothetical protein
MQAPPPLERKRERPPNFYTELPPEENTTEFGKLYSTLGPEGIAVHNRALGNAYRKANPPATQPPVTPAWPSMVPYTLENLKKLMPGYGTSTSTFEPLHQVRKGGRKTGKRKQTMKKQKKQKKTKRRSKLTRKSRK